MGARAQFSIDAGAVALAADRWPGGGPTVVLLHSGVTDRRSWHAVADLLGDGLDLVAYDRRGFGQTPLGDGDFSDLADLGSVLRTLDGAPVWLVGSSQGGRIALDAALRHRDRVAGLVLIGSAVSGIPDDAPYAMDAQTEALEQRYADALQRRDRDELRRVCAWLWLDGPGRPEGRVTGAPRALMLDMVAAMTRPDERRGRAPGEPEAWAQLERVDVPALVAVGEYDTFLVPLLRDVAARMPRAAFRLLPGTAHLPMLDQPEVVAGLIADATRGYPSAG